MKHSPDRIPETPKLISISHRIDDVPLKGRFHSIKASAIVSAANQRYVFGVRPAQRHRRSGRKTATRMPAWQVIAIPQLLADHSSFIGEVFQRHYKQFRVISSRKFIMTSFAG